MTLLNLSLKQLNVVYILYVFSRQIIGFIGNDLSG